MRAVDELTDKQLDDIKNILIVFANYPDTRDDLLKAYIGRLMFQSYTEGFAFAQRLVNLGQPLHLPTK